MCYAVISIKWDSIIIAKSNGREFHFISTPCYSSCLIFVIWYCIVLCFVHGIKSASASFYLHKYILIVFNCQAQNKRLENLNGAQSETYKSLNLHRELIISFNTTKKSTLSNLCTNTFILGAAEGYMYFA